MAFGSFRDPSSRTEFLKNIATGLAGADQSAAVRFIEEQWLAAPTRIELLWLVPIVEPLVPQQPEIASEINASFGWVEQILLAV
jgi:hypothetical protein